MVLFSTHEYLKHSEYTYTTHTHAPAPTHTHIYTYARTSITGGWEVATPTDFGQVVVGGVVGVEDGS